ncbi:Beta-galactosidase C-terminal domain, partial [Marisediminicola senii]|uniref:Beta-galactosidase C-terminal domain n=1 Tax=Marisediminicola senii TaxID=2711233 RepID=UPI001F44E722
SGGLGDVYKSRPDETVTVSSGAVPSGTRFWFVHNWSEKPATAVAPADLIDALGGESLSAGDDITLGPWAVRVFSAG